MTCRLPDLENIQRVGEVIGEFVEQDVTETSAENDAYNAPSQEVVEHFLGKGGVEIGRAHV